jgi:hypothetical protein
MKIRSLGRIHFPHVVLSLFSSTVCATLILGFPLAPAAHASSVQISVGNSGGCVVEDSGNVRCWGYALYRGVGISDPAASATGSAQIVGVSGVKQVGVGASHVCAVKTDQTVWCWGSNNSGEIGNGVTPDSNGQGTQLSPA